MNASLVVALCPVTGGIAHNDQIPYFWNVKGDLKRFKDLTMGRTIAMGRKTWESIPRSVRPFEGRNNIVISSRFSIPTYHEGATWLNSIDDVFSWCKRNGFDQPVFIGGKTIYEDVIKKIDEAFVTLVNPTPEHAGKEYDVKLNLDVFRFPMTEWEVAKVEPVLDRVDCTGLHYPTHTYIHYVRRGKTPGTILPQPGRRFFNVHINPIN